jgi:hypothetical protein
MLSLWEIDMAVTLRHLTRLYAINQEMRTIIGPLTGNGPGNAQALIELAQDYHKCAQLGILLADQGTVWSDMQRTILIPDAEPAR